MADKTLSNIFGGMGDYAKKARLEKLKKKYGAAPPAMAAQMASEDQTIDDAHLPDVHGKKMPAVAVTISEGMDDVAHDADKWAAENKAAIDGFAGDDEEDAKWMAKQKG